MSFQPERRETFRGVLTQFALSCLLAIAFAAGLHAQTIEYPEDGTRIVDIEIRGLNSTSEDLIRNRIGLREGDTFNARAADQALAEITQIPIYDPLKKSFTFEEAGSGVSLIIEVQETPVIESIDFIGNVKFTAKELQREIDYAPGQLSPYAPKSTIDRSLRKLYSDTGFGSAKVSTSVERSPADPTAVRLIITIDEGERILIRDFRVSGNEFASDYTLGRQVFNSGSWGIFKNYYDDGVFEEDLRTIEAWYFNKGFLDARARRGRFEYDESKGEIIVEVNVVEGPRYVISDATFEGNGLITDEELRTAFLPVLGQTFDGDRVQEARRRAFELYGAEGFVDTAIPVRLLKDPSTGEVVLAATVRESDIVYVGDIFVNMKSYEYDLDLNKLEEFIDWMSPGVKEETVRKELKLVPGARYRSTDEARTIERLRRLGFLSNVDVNRIPTSDPNVNDVMIEVEEDANAGYISATAGLGEVTGLTVGLNYVNPNLFGEGKVLRAGVLLGDDVRSFGASYRDRHFFGTDQSLELSGYRDYFRFSAYGQRTYGGYLEVGFPLSSERDDLRGYLRPRLEHVRLERRDQNFADDVDSYVTAALRGTVEVDKRNDVGWTSAGYQYSFGLEAGVARSGMLKFLHRLNYYYALSQNEDWVYFYQHNVGLMPYDATEIGISERFFAGGISTLRGFRPRGIGPKDAGVDIVAIGGSTLIAQRHELRHRFTDFFSGRLFVDAAILEESFLEIDQPRVGAGAGVTFNLGIVAVDFDLGSAIVRQDTDRTRAFHFRIRSVY